jgi:PTS system mannose-specific IIA component
MIGILILAPAAIGDGLIEAVEHIFGQRPPLLETVPVDDSHRTPEQLTEEIKEHMQHLAQADGILILADIYGASHTNTACQLVSKGQVELVSGVNLPMLVRVLNHRKLALSTLVTKATSGGAEGILCASDQLEKRRPKQ